MIKKLLFSLIILLINSIVVAQTDSISWENPYFGSVNTIHETSYGLDPDTILDITSFTDNDFLNFEQGLFLKDSTITFFNNDEIIISNLSYCVHKDSSTKMNPCFSFMPKYDTNSVWIGSEVINFIENDTIFYNVLKHNLDGLPEKIEGRNKDGKLIEFNYYEMNKNGFIKKIIIEDLVYSGKREVVRNYEENNYTLSSNSFKYFILDKEEYQLRFEVATTYEYLKFDKKGNWTKRRNIKDNNNISYTYRTYVYNQ